MTSNTNGDDESPNNSVIDEIGGLDELIKLLGIDSTATDGQSLWTTWQTLLIVLIALGSLSNLIAFIVHRRMRRIDKLQQKKTFFWQTMIVFDTICLLMSTAHVVAKHQTLNTDLGDLLHNDKNRSPLTRMSRSEGGRSDFKTICWFILRLSNNIATTSTAWIRVFYFIDRYQMILKPLLAMSTCVIRIMIRVTLTTLGAIGGSAIYHLLELQSGSVADVANTFYCIISCFLPHLVSFCYQLQSTLHIFRRQGYISWRHLIGFPYILLNTPISALLVYDTFFKTKSSAHYSKIADTLLGFFSLRLISYSINLPLLLISDTRFRNHLLAMLGCHFQAAETTHRLVYALSELHNDTLNNFYRQTADSQQQTVEVDAEETSENDDQMLANGDRMPWETGGFKPRRHSVLLDFITNRPRHWTSMTDIREPSHRTEEEDEQENMTHFEIIDELMEYLDILDGLVDPDQRLVFRVKKDIETVCEILEFRIQIQRQKMAEDAAYRQKLLVNEVREAETRRNTSCSSLLVGSNDIISCQYSSTSNGTNKSSTQHTYHWNEN